MKGEYDQMCDEWSRYNFFTALWVTLKQAYYGLLWWKSIRKSYRNHCRVKVFSFSKSWRGFRLIFGRSYEDNYPQLVISPGWGWLCITLPFFAKDDSDFFSDDPQYGIYYHESILWFWWGRKNYTIPMPYEPLWVRTSQLMKDLSWVHETKDNKSLNFWDDEIWGDKKWKETYPYTYTLENGEVQNRQATVTISEREWRQRWLLWTSWSAKVCRVIDIEFDGEVGERTGSWKGGTIGCGYDLRADETPEQCLRRMENEKRFN